MISSSVSMPAFRFLDVRAPRTELNQSPRYVVTRRYLDFPETDFERALKHAHAGEEDSYVTAITAAAEAIAAEPSPSGGFIAARKTYEGILTAKEVSPEDVFVAFRRFYEEHKGAMSEESYLLTRIAATWNLYVALTILKSFGKSIDPYLFSELGSAIRIAAAIFEMRRVPVDAEPDIRTFAVASIRIERDLFDPGIVRRTREESEPFPIDEKARELQNYLVTIVLRHILASEELRTVLCKRTATIEPPQRLVESSKIGTRQKEGEK